MVYDLHQFAEEFDVKVNDVIMFSQLCDAARIAIERAMEVNDEAYTTEAEMRRTKAEQFAKKLCFKVEWLGLWPTLTRGDDSSINPPRIEMKMMVFGNLPAGTTYQHTVGEPCYYKKTQRVVGKEDDPDNNDYHAPDFNRCVNAVVGQRPLITKYGTITKERAELIWAKRTVQLDITNQVTEDEDRIVKALWDRMPGASTYMDAFLRFRNQP